MAKSKKNLGVNGGKKKPAPNVVRASFSSKDVVIGGTSKVVELNFKSDPNLAAVLSGHAECRINQLMLTFNGTGSSGAVCIQATTIPGLSGTYSQLVSAGKSNREIKPGCKLADQTGGDGQWYKTTDVPDLIAHVAATVSGELGFVTGTVSVSVRGAGNF